MEAALTCENWVVIGFFTENQLYIFQLKNHGKHIFRNVLPFSLFYTLYWLNQYFLHLNKCYAFVYMHASIFHFNSKKTWIVHFLFNPLPFNQMFLL